MSKERRKAIGVPTVGLRMEKADQAMEGDVINPLAMALFFSNPLGMNLGPI